METGPQNIRLRVENRMIRNIVFDVGCVLLDYTWRETFGTWYGEEDVRILGGILFGEDTQEDGRRLWVQYDNGLISDAEIRSASMAALPQYAKALEWFFENPAAWAVEQHDMTDLITPLKEKGYGVYLLSNYPETLWKEHVCNKKFYAQADGAVVSWEEHLGKPDPAFFRTLLTRYSLTAEECLFLDDREENTRAAGELGFQTLTLKSADARQEALGLLRALEKLTGTRN